MVPSNTTTPKVFTLCPLGTTHGSGVRHAKGITHTKRSCLRAYSPLQTQYRILASLPIIWFCDNQATRSFLDSPPPTNARLRRWYTFLAQFKLTIKHIAGLKNEFCDWLSRSQFEELTLIDFDSLAKEAFEHMDVQLDFSIQTLFRIAELPDINPEHYLQSDWKKPWESNPLMKTTMVNEKMIYRTDHTLFCDTKRVVPQSVLPKVLQWFHQVNGHPVIETNHIFFYRQRYSELPKKFLLQPTKTQVVDVCEVCLRAKPKTENDLGMSGSLAIPQVSNDIVYIDFIHIDPHKNFEYILTMVIFCLCPMSHVDNRRRDPQACDEGINCQV